MSGDYKKIALEDVKKGQRVHINLYFDSLVSVSYTGPVVDTDTELKTVSLGSELEQFRVFFSRAETPDVFLLEDTPEPDTPLTRMTTTFETTGILRFASVEHWERHEPRLRDKLLKDSDGDVWAYIDGQWKYLEVDGWHDDVHIDDYIVKGFTIVDSLD